MLMNDESEPLPSLISGFSIASVALQRSSYIPLLVLPSTSECVAFLFLSLAEGRFFLSAVYLWPLAGR